MSQSFGKNQNMNSQKKDRLRKRAPPSNNNKHNERIVMIRKWIRTHTQVHDLLSLKEQKSNNCNSSSSSSSRRRIRKAVSFDDKQNVVHSVQNYKTQLPKPERNSIWYTRGDIIRFQLEYKYEKRSSLQDMLAFGYVVEAQWFRRIQWIFAQ